jgi:antitoxin (DNA-binding transcriptional repressor) of toxin-antitoxin stability system
MHKLDLRGLLVLDHYDLVERIEEILRLIDNGETIEVIDQSKVIAHIVPANSSQKPVDNDETAFI